MREKEGMLRRTSWGEVAYQKGQRAAVKGGLAQPLVTENKITRINASKQFPNNATGKERAGLLRQGSARPGPS